MFLSLDVLRDTSKPLMKTDKISKEILNIKYKNHVIMSKTISQFQTFKPLETKRIKQIVEPVVPEINVDDYIIAEIVKKKDDED